MMSYITISYYIMALQIIPDVHRATHRIGLYIAKCPGVAVNQAEAHILAHLHTQGDCTIAQLHRAFAHKRSTLTSILDRLVERKLVTRDVAAEDRRSFRVRLTAAGARVAAKVHQYLETLERSVLAEISAAQLRAFTRVIKLIGERAGTGNTGE